MSGLNRFCFSACHSLKILVRHYSVGLLGWCSQKADLTLWIHTGDFHHRNFPSGPRTFWGTQELNCSFNKCSSCQISAFPCRSVGGTWFQRFLCTASFMKQGSDVVLIIGKWSDISWCLLTLKQSFVPIQLKRGGEGAAMRGQSEWKREIKLNLLIVSLQLHSNQK